MASENQTADGLLLKLRLILPIIYITNCSGLGCVAAPQQTIAPATKAENNPLSKNSTDKLTEAERDIARKIGFEEKVLLLLKQRLNAQMGIVKSGGLEQEDLSFIHNRNGSKAPLLEKDKLNYVHIVKQYPQLKEVVDQQLRDQGHIDLLIALQKAANVLNTDQGRRRARFINAMAPYQSLIAQESLDKGLTTSQDHAKGFTFINPPRQFESDEAVDKAIEENKKRLAAQTLRPENRGSLYLGLRFPGIGENDFQSDKRVEAIRNELEKLDYRITEEIRGIKESRQFESREEAEKYLQLSGTKISGLSLSEQKARQYNAIFPVHLEEDLKNEEDAKTIVLQSSPFLEADDTQAISQALNAYKMLGKKAGFFSMPMGSLLLAPGATVKQTGERRWQINTPQRYTATATIKVATVVKVANNDIGLDMVRTKSTNGINYGITNEMIVQKLKDWDKQYGITVLEANQDSMKVQFKTLPQNLSRLCTEIFLFCPSMQLSDDENNNAAIMRECANSLRATNQATFWWD